jgi:hypothetical protein
MAELNSITNVPKIAPGQNPIELGSVPNPMTSGLWWTTQTISDLPENVMGWLVAQGFEITGIRQDKTTVPPTNYFSVRKDSLQPQLALLALCNTYTVAANEARTANQQRYTEVLANYTSLIDSSHLQFDAQVEEQNAQSGVFLTDLDEYMTEVEAMILDNQTQIIIDAENAKDALDQMMLRLGDLETNAANNATVIKALFTKQDSALTTYVSDYDSKLAELDQNFASYLGEVLSKISSLDGVLDGHIAEYSAQFVTLSNNYTAHAEDLAAQLAKVEVNVSEYTSDVEDILTSIEADYDQVANDLDQYILESGSALSGYSGNYDAVLELMQSDYDAHAPVTRAFLTNLGQTELARINEQFASSLSSQMQMLVSRGLSMSTIPVDVTARSDRDKDEQIQLLNDRLNREKLENENLLYSKQLDIRTRKLEIVERRHAAQQDVIRFKASLVSSVYGLRSEATNRVLAGKQAVFAAKDANIKYGMQISADLYAKLQDIRQRTIDSVDRIYQLRDIFAKWDTEEASRRYERIQQIESQFLESIQRQYVAGQDIIKTEMGERHTLLTQLQAALTALMSGKERYAVLLMQNANTLAEHKHRAIVQMMETAVRRLDGWKTIADQNRTLMAYQLDERNKLLIGLYSFVERREDVAPEWKDMTKMIAGLADSGGGWLTPN